MIKLLFNASVAFTDCMLMYAVRIYYGDFEKILCFWLVPLWNGGVPLKSIHVIIEYVNSNTHAVLDCITVQLQETTHH